MKTNIKNLSKILTVVLISLSLTAFLLSCKKDSSNPIDGSTGGNGDNNGGVNNTVTLNGDGWINKSLIITNCFATYKPSSQLAFTEINMICPDNISLYVTTPGNQTGTFNFANAQSSSEAMFVLTYGTGLDADYYFGSNNSGTITISSYGEVGQNVNGSFTGKVVHIKTGAEVTVNGTFSATRSVDVVDVP